MTRAPYPMSSSTLSCWSERGQLVTIAVLALHLQFPQQDSNGQDSPCLQFCNAPALVAHHRSARPTMMHGSAGAGGRSDKFAAHGPQATSTREAAAPRSTFAAFLCSRGCAEIRDTIKRAGAPGYSLHCWARRVTKTRCPLCILQKMRLSFWKIMTM